MNKEWKSSDEELSEDDYIIESNAGQAFTLKQTDISLPSPIKVITFTEKCSLLVMENNQILRKRLEIDEEYKPIPYGVETQINKIYSDINGYHSIIILDQNEYYYLNLSEDNLVPLKSLLGMEITSITFGQSISIMATKEILLGTIEGSIYTYSLERNYKLGVIETSPKKVFQFSSNAPIRGIIFDSSVIVATDEVLYEFVGELPFANLFEKYHGDSDYKKTAAKGRLGKAELRVCHCYKEGKYKLHSFAWKTGEGIIHGNFTNANSILKQTIIEPYTKRTTMEPPNFIIISEDYIFLAYSDITYVVSKIGQEVVCSEERGYNEVLRCGVYDPTAKCFWITSDRKLFRMLLTTKERSDSTKFNYENYVDTLKECKERDENEYIKLAGVYANALMEDGKFEEAAVLYRDSKLPFESIVLKFMRAEAYDQLTIYLTQLLESMKGKKIQRLMLCTLLLELQLDKLNKLGAELEAELPESSTTNTAAYLYNKASKDFNSFLEKYEADLDLHTTFQLLQNHRRVNDSLSFAILKKDYEAVLLYHLNKHDYKAAIEVVNEIKNDREKNKLIKRYAARFIKHETKLTIDSLSRYYPTIDPESLIMSIINVDTQQRIIVNSYIRSIMDCVKSKLLYSLHIFFLAEDQSQKSLDELNDFLEQQETLRRSKQPLNIDANFALMTFKNFGLIDAQIKVYGLIEFYEKAVRLSIKHKKYMLAKECASLPQDEKLRKELWLMIAEAIIKENDNNESIGIEIMNESKVLTLGDILPFLSPKMMLSSFKGDLVISLQAYGEKLRELKGQMNDYTKSAEEINVQLRDLKNSCIPIPSDQHCNKCKKQLIGNVRFYVFPCLHCFHRNCIIEWLFEYKTQIPKTKLSKLKEIVGFMRRMAEIEKKREESEAALDQSDFRGLLSKIGNIFMRTKIKSVEEQKKVEISAGNQEKLKEYEQELERLLAEDCILCGFLLIESVDAKFDSSKEGSWQL